MIWRGSGLRRSSRSRAVRRRRKKTYRSSLIPSPGLPLLGVHETGKFWPQQEREGKGRVVGRYSWSEKRSPYHTTYFRPVPFFSVPNSRRVVAVFPSFLVFRLFHRDFSIHLLALVYRWSSRAFPPLSPFPPPLRPQPSTHLAGMEFTNEVGHDEK